MKIVITNLDGQDVTNEYQNETLENLEVLVSLGVITVNTYYENK